MCKSNFCLILLLLAVPFSNCEPSNLWASTIFNQTSINYLKHLILPNYVDFKYELPQNTQLGVECKAAIQQSISALNSKQQWAFELFNSWAKFPPSGLVQGTMVDFGDYRQCFHAKGHQLGILPQYCVVEMAVPMKWPIPLGHNLFNRADVLPSSSESKMLANTSFYRHLEANAAAFYYAFINIGVCLPANCSQRDAEVIFNLTSTNYGFKLNSVKCERSSTLDLNLNSTQIAAIIFFAIVISLTIAAAIYDNYSAVFKSYGLEKCKCLLYFSPLRNTRKLLFAKTQDDELACIHGIRTVTMIWIVMGHTLDWNRMNSFRDTFTIKNRLTELQMQPFYRSLLTVDTFFFISGLLTSYVTVKYTARNLQKFNSIAFIVLRYLRLTPQLIAYLMLTFLLPLFFDGPIWRSYISVNDRCYSNWWLDLAYLQNIIDVKNICGLHTWFIAADMQLHWLSLIPVIWWLKNRRSGTFFVAAIILGSIAASAVQLYVNTFPPGSVMTSKNDLLDENGQPTPFLMFYYSPLSHAYVFFIGFLFGDYIKANEQQLKTLRLSKIKAYLLWIGATSGFAFAVYCLFPWVLGRPYESFWSAVLFPLSLITWSLGMVLVIWLCATDNAGAFGRFLSSPVFRPLSRLTYCVYLTHVWTVWATIGARYDLIDIRVHSVVLLFGGVVLISYLIGFVFTILFECPVINLINELKRMIFLPESTKLKAIKDESSESILDSSC